MVKMVKRLYNIDGNIDHYILLPSNTVTNSWDQ